MSKTAFYCKIEQDTKDKYDIALIKSKRKHGNREEITEKLFKFFIKNGMTEKVT